MTDAWLIEEIPLCNRNERSDVMTDPVICKWLRKWHVENSDATSICR